MSQVPEVSIVIPIYNEQGILHAALVDLRERLKPLGWDYEIVLAENGSRDRTVAIGEALVAKYPEIRLLSTGEPNYGKALRLGIAAARGKFVICDEIDLCDVDFHVQALDILRNQQADMVIGSKLIAGAEDERPLIRHAASMFYTGSLRLLLGFRGTDTHGLKAFRRDALASVAEACVTDKDVFASEFVIRAYRDELRVLEVPIHVMEKRPPSINLFKRVPNVLKNVGKLAWVIHFGKQK